MSTGSILVVDDNPVNLKLVQVLLRGAGYELRCAGSAAEALACLREQRPRLVLMDIQLPDINGLEFTRQLKQDPDFRDLPVVALSAYAMKGDVERALASGCSGYISKPINTRDFAATVAGYLAPHGGGEGER